MSTATTELRARALHGDARSPSRERIFVIALLLLLVIVSVVPWRSQTIYEGGVDSVVVGKALVAVVALGGALLLWTRTRVHMPIGLGPAAVLVIVLLTSLLGSVVAGNDSATFVLVVRMSIVLATLLLLLSAAPWNVVLSCLLAAMSVLAVVAAVTGATRLTADGRLGGGTPEIHPNELAGLCAPPFVALVILMLRRGVQLWSALAAIVLLGILVASGSRTALLGVAIAVVLAILTNGIHNRSVVYVLLGSLPLAYAIASFTGVLTSLATRSGSTDTTSALDSRFDAWRVVLAWDWSLWEKWIGLGLSVKKVRVDLRWREEQVLDSSWASLLAQAGLIGTVLVLLLLAWCVVTAVIARSRRGVILPLLSLLIMRSVTESGLVDSAMPFVLLVVLSTLLTHRSRHAAEMLDGTYLSRADSQQAPAVRAIG